MKRLKIFLSLALALTLVLPVYGDPTAATQEEQPPQLVDEASIEAVIDAMTLREKAALLVGGNKEVLEETDNEIIGDQATKVPGAAGQTQGIPRLGIPSIVMADGPMGVRISPTREEDEHTYHATQFPLPISIGASWDTELVNEMGNTISDEMRAYGIDLLLAPGLNTQSYLLNGRNHEYFSEDPVLTGKMTSAFTDGVQENGVGVTLKHLAAYNQRADNNVDSIVSQRALREIYLKGFEMAVKDADPWAVMDSYNKINGTWATEHQALLTDVLRDDWGFNGIAMTDWEFGARNVAKQMEAGTNLLMPGRPEQVDAIVDAVNSGTLDEAILDRNVEEMLRIIVQTPTFKGETVSNNPDLNRNAKVSRQAAADGMVLLKNEGNALPIDPDVSVSVFGTPQIEPMFGGRGSSLNFPAEQVGIVEGLDNAGFQLNKDLYEKYETYVEELRATDEYKQTPGNFFVSTFPTLPEMDVTEEAVTAAENTDAAIIVLASEFGSYGNDRSKEDFYLSDSKQQMIEHVSAAYRAQGKPVIAILNVEGPLEVVSWRDKVDAIVVGWQPGQEFGHALADVITGAVNPSGKLPLTWPVDYSDLPYADRYPGDGELVYEEDIYVGYRYNTTFDVTPAYAFGYGLSYTDFNYSHVRTTRNGQFKDKITIFTTIENTGDTVGREVVQVYVSKPDGKLEKPELELAAFGKTKELRPNQRENLKFELQAKDIASFDEELSAWVLEQGTYEVKVGSSSTDIKGTVAFTVKQDTIVEEVNDVLAPQVDIDRLSKGN
ncbi:beta-glucosidase [Caldalkalibacillus salinus]|uniref:beta-glucosidase n=1 Tax=Caldalkalibacillus salinus TaxID=2803787 RepID=UPI0019243D23|nr:glycoside hydrolase family 3 N-terminal domain-containing protein [Caldalkalibacillus salinus]